MARAVWGQFLGGLELNPGDGCFGMGGRIRFGRPEPVDLTTKDERGVSKGGTDDGAVLSIVGYRGLNTGGYDGLRGLWRWCGEERERLEFVAPVGHHFMGGLY